MSLAVTMGMTTSHSNMKGKRKPFNREVYNNWDAAAKEAVASHLSTQGYDVRIPPENYGADLYHTHPSKLLTVHHEVEVSLTWGDVSFPYPTGSIPERKIRLKSLYTGPLYFWMLNNKLNRAVVFSSAHLISKWLVEVPNSQIPEGEYFYRVPLEFGRIIDPLQKGD